MPGPCSQPPGGKSRYVRMTKQKHSDPKHGYPKTLAARIKELPTNVSGKLKYNRPGSYKK